MGHARKPISIEEPYFLNLVRFPLDDRANIHQKFIFPSQSRKEAYLLFIGWEFHEV
jgi:hypothetical protein